jgi:hypothetical protein
MVIWIGLHAEAATATTNLHTCEKDIEMSKQQAKGNKAIVAANETGLQHFPASDLRKAFDSMAALANDADAATDSRQAAALDVLVLAESFAIDNESADTETIAAGWRDNLKVLTMELAVSGNRFAELKEGKGDSAATAKLTGYGNNVASIAKGVIQFDMAVNGNFESYREARKAVEAARAEARRDSDPDAAALADAKAQADDTWKELRETVFATGDILNVEALTASLQDALSSVQDQIAAANAIEADADAAALEAAMIEAAA